MHVLFDIGATKMRVAGTKDLDSFHDLKTAETPENFEEGMEKLTGLIREVSGGEIEAIAGGIAGSYIRKEDKLFASPNMKGWVNKPFGKILKEEFGVPMYIDNDTAMAVIGEAIRGAGKNYKIAGYITVSTGMGGSRAVGGVVDERAVTYEPGHQVILANGEEKTLEELVSGNGVKKRFGKEPYEIQDEEIWNELAGYLGIGLYNTIVHWSPEIMVLGGPMITGNPSIPLEKVKKKVKDLLIMFPDLPEIVKSELGDENGLYGAMELLKSKTADIS